MEKTTVKRKTVKKTETEPQQEQPITVPPKVEQRGDMNNKMVPALVLLLIGAAFAVGLLYGKVSVYEKGGGTPSANTGTPTTGGQNVPQEPPNTDLTEAQWQQVLDKAEFVKGDKNAKVTIAEFTDYQCPYCANYYKDTYPQIMKDYVDTNKVRYVLMELPLPFHSNAKPASLAARCAGEQNKYWEMHDKLFSNQEQWSNGDPKTMFAGYAKDIGLNTSKYAQCYDSGKYNEQIDDTLALAQQIGANGTPTFYINGKQLVGAVPYSQFQTKLEEALK